ncbi:MAG: hypothetical protein V4726_01040 [Verrucomicrobiota bacterium]
MNASRRLTLIRKYRAMWAEAAVILQQRGFSKAEAECYRDEVTMQALGMIKSSGAFTEGEFDKVFQCIKTITKADDLESQLEPPDARLRRQLLWSIGQEEKFPGYAGGISQDIYGRRDFEKLPTDDLMTLRRRIGNDKRGYHYSSRKSGADR